MTQLEGLGVLGVGGKIILKPNGKEGITMTQLEEAELIINEKDEFHKRVLTSEYMAKYYPKDELFEKYKEFYQSSIQWDAAGKRTPAELEFEKAKSLSLFTHVLDEAIEYVEKSAFSYCPINKLKEIRTKYSSQS